MVSVDPEKPLMTDQQFGEYLAASRIFPPELMPSPIPSYSFADGEGVRIEYSARSLVEMVRRVDEQIEEDLTQEIVVRTLRSRGWTVEKGGGARMLGASLERSDYLADVFRAAWHEANRAGEKGKRVRRGLEAVADVLANEGAVCDGACDWHTGPDEECSAHGRMPSELWEALDRAGKRRDDALAIIDKTFDNVAEIDQNTPWTTAEVTEMLREIRAALTEGNTK